jgi:hypothetical protein
MIFLATHGFVLRKTENRSEALSIYKILSTMFSTQFNTFIRVFVLILQEIPFWSSLQGS